MALPVVTNIVRRSINRIGFGPLGTAFSEYYCLNIGSSQKRPIDRPLPYASDVYVATYSGNTNFSYQYGAGPTSSYCIPFLEHSAMIACRNKAYDKLKDELYAQAQTGASIAEFGQARDMITTRAKQLLMGAKALKRLDFQAAAKVFNVLGDPRTKRDFRKTRSFGNLWLEWHFGWTPMVKDIYEAAQVFTDPIKTVWARGSAKDQFKSTRVFFNQPAYSHKQDLVVDVLAVQGASVVINNPNVALAGQLGLLNPVSIAWELVPFSFVVDWYVNVGQVIGSMSDYAGMTLVNPYNTSVVRVSGQTVFASNWGEYDRLAVKGVNMRRGTGLIRPVFTVRPLKLPSLTRGVTQMSLLAQFLGRG